MNLNLDTRHNLLSVILVIGIGVLVLTGLLAFVLFGRADVESIEPSGAASSLLDQPVTKNPELGEISQYMNIVERPVFFADRQLPVLELAGQAEQPAPEPEPEPVVEIPDLEASVAGIIITPDVKLAMVTDNSSKETLVLREGMAMAGEKSAWKLAEIRARGVQFQTDNGRTEELELEVETSALKTGAPPRRQAAADAAQDNNGEPAADGEAPQDAEAAARARAEEIRRRVAERRAQLRAEAERRAREQDNDG